MKIITTTEEMQSFYKNIKTSSYIAIDTEFCRSKTYYPQAYLVQIASDKDHAIVDLLSTDLYSLAPILQNKNMVKIFHSAKQDLEILYRYFGQLPQNIFDTQIAASFCGFGSSVSYENLVYKLLGIKIDKTYQNSDWSVRPLNAQQISYALADVIHLKEIYPLLLNLLEQNQRLKWVIEDNNFFNQNNNFEVNFAHIWKKIKNVKEVNIVLKELAMWREKKAQKLNLPRNHFMSDRLLIKLSEQMPIEHNQIIKIDANLPADEIIDVIKEALKKDDSEDIVYITEELKKLAALKKILCQKATEHSLPPSLIATNQELKNFVCNRISRKPRFLEGWRYEVFGKFVAEKYT